jgi:4-amino-4-deoxy-L-arabinose transferase-like glycosyltransferase
VFPAAALSVIIYLRAWNIGRTPFPNDDEGTYLAQAWAVRHGAGLAHYTYWYDHPPLGWIQLSWLSWLPAWLAPDQPTFVQGRIAMLPVAAAGALLVHLVARRVGLGRPAALAAMLLYGLSPLAVTMSRQIYLDNFAVVWALAAFALALSPRRHLWHHVASGAALAAAVLSKETILVVLPALLVALWQGSDPRTRTFSFAGFASGFALTGMFYPLYAILKGELLPGPGHVSLVGSLGFQLGSRAGTGSVFRSGTEAHTLLGDWFATDPLLIAGGAAAALAALAVRRLRPVALAAVILALVAARPGGYLPKMYVIQLLPFLAIALAGMAQTAVRAAVQAVPGSAGRPAIRLTAGVALLATAAALFGPVWYRGDRDTVRTDDTTVYYDAAQWLRDGHIADPARTRVVTDGVLWLDAVDAGFTPGTGVIWHYKLDNDPAIEKTMPHGWRDIDYVVSTPALRGERQNLPTVRDLLAHSTVVATFGEGDGRIDILKVGEVTKGGATQ